VDFLVDFLVGSRLWIMQVISRARVRYPFPRKTNSPALALTRCESSRKVMIEPGRRVLRRRARRPSPLLRCRGRCPQSRSCTNGSHQRQARRLQSSTVETHQRKPMTMLISCSTTLRVRSASMKTRMKKMATSRDLSTSSEQSYCSES